MFTVRREAVLVGFSSRFGFSLRVWLLRLRVVWVGLSDGLSAVARLSREWASIYPKTPLR